ncbi:MAG: PAS domain-containing sensor histidine kinase [Candidatus Rokuibacteriota bacterium]|nr:MAG: PAS domain-containing sensor histidine kinase [Candidatus Rokubacteria bacterium]
MPLTTVAGRADEQDRRKRNLLIIAGILVLLIVATVFEVGIRAPQIPFASNLIVFALFNLNLIVFLLLLVLLFRNLVKLSFEHRHKVIGARFKAKLVLTFLALALTPGILIFIIASNFITTSIEGWFKPQVERPLDQAMEVAQTYYQTLESTALRHARYMARVVEKNGLLDDSGPEAMAAYLAEQQERLGVASITVFNRQGRELVHVKNQVLASSVPSRETNREHVRQALAGHEITTVHELDNGDMIQAVVPIRDPERGGVAAAMVVGIHVPQRLEARLRGISQAFQEYKQLKLLKNPIKGIYILLFLLMTLIIVFSATWFGLYLARGITDPIQKLAEGTREVAAGNLKYKVEVRADDEIGILVDSFNRMTGDLAASQAKLEETYRDLQAKHNEVEQRRHYTETVLETVATGVVSLDPAGHVTTINGAAERMLGLPAARIQGRVAAQAFRSPQYAEIAGLIQRMGRARHGMLDREVHLRRDGQTVALLASATALKGPDGAYMGMVLAFDDLTELLKAQRLAAWREVAQRIAHEIKNPLTPIQLSAQRLRRRLAGERSPEEKRLLEEATATIIQEVDALKQLVDEFSRFARMPALTLRPTDLGRLLESVVGLYRDSHPALSIKASFSPDLPSLEVDPDQIKRAVLNLVDNAVEAVGQTGEVTVQTVWLPQASRARIIVTDDGPGIAADDKEKLFVPYFSTKATGMGLGLPIVHQIVSDHGGTIWVEDNPPRGSRFVIELPGERVTAAAAAPA